MPKRVMDRRAADNEYLHKDFHGALNCGIVYLHRHFGEEAVREYLRDFGRRWHAPLRQRLLTEGLPALRRHFETLFGVEGATVRFEQTPDELVLHVEACPAVAHIRAQGGEASPLFVETTRTVNEALCEGTPYLAELLSYDPQTGRSVQRFRRRTP
jgi:hypothetical protein